MITALAFIGGFVLAFVFAQFQKRSEVKNQQELNEKLKSLEAKNEQNLRLLGALETENRQIKEFRGDMTKEFENLAHKIFEKSSDRLLETSEKNLQNLLFPLREKLGEFQKRVEETYAQESREVFSLKNEIKNILEANQRISSEANRLTTALRGDVRAQGAWGELVLKKILEASGLREGHEYKLQAVDMGLKSDDGRTQKPDVIVNLPDNKHLIVDSKVSLVHYEKTVAADEITRTGSQKMFLQSLYQHVDGLSAKTYHNLEGLSAPDFTMMFVPMEGAFSLAMQLDSDLFTYAWNKRIVIVSPTTLLATLRTVASIWNQERQNKNAIEIARQGGALYDKFVNFLDDLKDLGSSIEKSNEHYTRLVGKISTGKGNLISRVERLKDLGAKTTKEISSDLINDLDE